MIANYFNNHYLRIGEEMAMPESSCASYCLHLLKVFDVQKRTLKNVFTDGFVVGIKSFLSN